jgi:hypothetical protein
MYMSRANVVLSPGYLPFETGYRRLDAVQIEVAALHRMHAVKGAMLEWWMRQIATEGWFMRGNPARNVAMKWIDRPPPGEYLGATIELRIRLGGELTTWKARYHPPADMLDTSRFEDRGITHAVCARIGAANAPFWAGNLVRAARDTEFGCELRSRYWFGDTGRKEEAPDPETLALVTTDRFAEAILAYDLESMEHLASFLPELHAASR